METSAPAAKVNGLSTVVNTIASPSEAFETLRIVPTWGWACLLTIVLMLIGTYLQGPAARHAAVIQMQHTVATSSLFANIPATQKQAMIAKAGQPSVFAYVGPAIGVFFVVLLNTLLMLIGNAVGRGQADFKRLWAGSMNIAVPTLGLGALVLGIIVSLRNPDSFSSAMGVMSATPSLAWLVPHGSPALLAFATGISVFTLWGLFLNATMLRVMAKTSAGVAWTFAALVTLLGALFAAGALQALHNMKLA